MCGVLTPLCALSSRISHFPVAFSTIPARVDLLKCFPVARPYCLGIYLAAVAPSANRPALRAAVFLKFVSSDAMFVNKQKHSHVRYKILKVMNMKFMALCDVMPSSLEGMYFSDLQGHCCCVCIHGLFNDTRNERLHSNE